MRWDMFEKTCACFQNVVPRETQIRGIFESEKEIMITRIVLVVSLALVVSNVAVGQNTSATTTARPRTTTNSTSSRPSDSQTSTDTQKPTPTSPAAQRSPVKPVVIVKQAPGSDGVLGAFEALLKGIRKADVAAVTGIYWN